MVGHGRGGHGATGRGTPIEDVGDQGVGSQTQQGVDRGVTSRGRHTQQETGRRNPTPVVSRPIVGPIEPSVVRELKVDVLHPSLFVESPVGGRVSLDQICRKCELMISDRLFVFDFVLLDMSSFDVILGMDWLSNFHATIDCYRRRVQVCTSEGEWFSFLREKSDPLEPSLSDARNCESIICTLASLISDDRMITHGELPLIVSEFSDVFLEDLYDLPPKREVEFSIELLPGTAPISMPPYQFAPAELRELKI
ncbi:uncharacterized protein LOC130789722 [Actinidia eriantha]|uniref:uncharacterized protein LOC130789722 n=1 Tax=Actinidia eriantha TaxID=165200 RepID=UPI00258A91C2|nr:uncharacterized protein LOC130789722 [Actinidia eriantha]